MGRSSEGPGWGCAPKGATIYETAPQFTSDLQPASPQFPDMQPLTPEQLEKRRIMDDWWALEFRDKLAGIARDDEHPRQMDACCRYIELVEGSPRQRVEANVKTTVEAKPQVTAERMKQLNEMFVKRGLPPIPLSDVEHS
jgi:hypothetical protein